MVTRCICHDVTFAELRGLADRTGADLTELSRRTGCGTGCGCCIPYIRLMLRTRQTHFPVLSAAAFAKLLEAPLAPREFALPGARSGVQTPPTAHSVPTRPAPADA